MRVRRCERVRLQTNIHEIVFCFHNYLTGVRMSRLFQAGVLACVFMTTGCASIVNGQNQSVSVVTRQNAESVSGANCKLWNNKGAWYVISPGFAVVRRSYEDLSVHCEKEGLDPGIASVKSATKAMAFGNIVFGGVVGAGVDMANGSAYDYPQLITVEMGKTSLIGLPPQAEGVQQETSAAN